MCVPCMRRCRLRPAGQSLDHGGGDLAGQFYDAGLLDEMILSVGSATLGRGKPLFPRRVLHPVLRLLSVRQIGEGMAVLQYEVRKSTA